jgi:hypothetical protein
MKYVAVVTKVLRPGIHKVGGFRDGEPVAKDLPAPDRVEIECEGVGLPCMMFRFTNEGEFCGDTWHESLASAFAQAKFEYGLSQEDFVLIEALA